MDDSHRLFLQHFLQHPVQEALQLKELYLLCTGSESFGKEAFTAFLGKANEQLAKLDLSIRQANCHVTGELFFVLCNLSADSSAFETLDLVAKQDLSLIRQILSAICLADENRRRATSIDLMNISSISSSSRGNNRQFTDKKKIEALLERLVDEKWLTKHKDYFYVGVRSIVELGSWLEGEFIFPRCQICHDFVVVGKFCRPGGACKSASHAHCLERFLSVNNANAQCAGCMKGEENE
jgi:hypothetical protein